MTLLPSLLSRSQQDDEIEAHANGHDPANMTQADTNALLAEIAALKAQNAKLAKRGTTIKVSDKGAVSVYGLGRFPVTLYQGQMVKLMGMKDDIMAFIEANKADLAVKE